MVIGLILGAVSAAMSVISSVASTVGPVLATAAKTCLSVAEKYFLPTMNIIESVAQISGVLRQNDHAEDLGRRAAVSEEKPENFDSTAAYIDHLKNEIQIDKEKMAAESPAEKLAYTALGAGVALKGIEEKKGFEVPMAVWETFAKLDLENKGKEVNALLDTFKGDAGKLADYAEGNLDAKSEAVVGDKLVETYQTLEPDMSEADIEKKVMQMEISDKA